MGLFDFIKSMIDPTMKDSSPDAAEVKKKRKWHCGYCGITLRDDDWMCPVCGGTPIDQNGKSK